MTAQWNDDFHHALHALLTGERQGYYADFGALELLAKVFTRVFVHDGGWSTFRGSDWGAPVDTARIPGHAFLAYTATHDQVGNRAAGDRPTATLTLGQAAIAAALTLTGPFTPMLFMGEEWGAATPWQFFTDHEDGELAESIRQGRRREFAGTGWEADHIPDPQDRATRDASVLDWQESMTGSHLRLLDWYRRLLALRRREGDLRDARLDRVRVGHDAERGWFVLRRGALRVVCNLSPGALTVPLDAAPVQVVLAWDRTVLERDGVGLTGHSVAVVNAGTGHAQRG